MAFLFVSVGILFVSALHKFFKGFARTMSSESRERTERMFKSFMKSRWLLMLMNLIVSYLPIFGVAHEAYVGAFATVYYLGTAFMLFCLHVIVVKSTGIIRTELSEVVRRSSHPNAELESKTLYNCFLTCQNYDKR